MLTRETGPASSARGSRVSRSSGMADGKIGSHVAFEDDVAFEGGASPRVGGLAEPARVEHEWRHAEYC